MKQNTAMIQRNALLDSIENSSKQIIYLHSPAGYGKSVLAQSWMLQKNEPYAVIVLDEFDNNIISFSRHFCQTLKKLEPKNESLDQLILHPSFGNAPDEFTLRVIETLDPANPARLVIDDLHMISDSHLLNLLSIYLKRMQDNIRIMITSRMQPPKCFSDFIVKDLIQTLTTNDLAFTVEEIIAIYKHRGLLLTAKKAKAIHRSTGGWAIGINAILLSGKNETDVSFISQHLHTFLEEQVWDKWEEKIQNFMLATALEEELTLSLCEELTGDPSSTKILENLVETHTFILKGATGNYYFHSIFRDFLISKLHDKDSFKKQQREKAAIWHEKNNDYIKALEAWLHVDDEEKTLNCFVNFLNFSNKKTFFIDKVLPIMHHPGITSIMEKHAHLLPFAAWTAFLNGDPKTMERHADRFYSDITNIMIQEPHFASQAYYLRLMDYRTNMNQLLADITGTPQVRLPAMKQGSGTITQNMALMHRSSRDLSEYAYETESIEDAISESMNTVGMLLGDEKNLFGNCVIGGLCYERGLLTPAHQNALDALTEIKESFTPESKFCAMSLLVYILRALWQFDRAELMIRQIEDMIEDDKAYYLKTQMECYLCRFKLEDGDIEAAKTWMEQRGTDPFDLITFHKLYGFFTTVRAHIVLGNNDKAIVILSKILELVQAYRRPLDIIEVKILLSIAFWKKKRTHQDKALDYLEEAILMAYPYGYTQLFVNEGAEVVNMLHRLQNRANRSNYTGKLPGNFTKMIYLRAKAQSSHTKGLTSGRNPEPVSFTGKQKTVMKLLSNGYSYRQIAEEMDIKFSTVRSHIELIYKKLDVPNENEAIMKIRDLNLFDGD